MKKLLFLIALLLTSVPSFSKNTFTIEDDLGVIASYEVTPKFLEHFASFVREQSSDYRPFLADIYRALQNGRNVSYNKDSNIIVGLADSDWSSLTPNELKRMHGRESVLSSTLNSKKHRFYLALSRLSYFKY